MSWHLRSAFPHEPRWRLFRGDSGVNFARAAADWGLGLGAGRRVRADDGLHRRQQPPGREGVLSELGQPRIMNSTVTLQRIFAELQSKIGSLFDDRSDDQRTPHGLAREIDGTPVAAERRAHY